MVDPTSYYHGHWRADDSSPAEWNDQSAFGTHNTSFNTQPIRQHATYNTTLNTTRRITKQQITQQDKTEFKGRLLEVSGSLVVGDTSKRCFRINLIFTMKIKSEYFLGFVARVVYVCGGNRRLWGGGRGLRATATVLSTSGELKRLRGRQTRD